MLRMLNSEEIVANPCEMCQGIMELCPAYFPWNEEFWICTNCGSTFIKEIERYKEKVDYGNSTTIPTV